MIGDLAFVLALLVQLDYQPLEFLRAYFIRLPIPSNILITKIVNGVPD